MTTYQTHALPWYVCRTKPRQEHLAMRKLEEQGYEVFMPLLPEWKKKNGAWQKHQEVMFPRYGFVRCGRTGQGVGPIGNTPGVTGLVRFCTVPATLNDTEIQAIRELADDQQELVRGMLPFRAGDAVVISSGPLKGMNGIVSKAAEERVTVLLRLLGREKPVGLLADQLALV